MFDGRSSGHGLVKQGTGKLLLQTGTFRFDGGTRVEAGNLHINSVATLASDVFVGEGGALSVWGTVTGDVDNRGAVDIGGTIDGNLANQGHVQLHGNYWFDELPARVTGDYLHADGATLGAVLGNLEGGYLSVTGRAEIQGGTLGLSTYSDAWGPYPLPDAPSSHLVLHADGGVFGEFDEWIASGYLFITGTLRYLPNDVYFDATSLSAQSVMQGSAAADAITLASAGRFDAALGNRGAASMPRDLALLTPTQQRFLRSAAMIQRIGSMEQALRTFDSLSGHGHLAVVDATMAHALRAAPTLSVHAQGTRGRTGAWNSAPEMVSLHGGAFTQGPTSGYDVQLANGLRLGSSVAYTNSQLDMDRSGGFAHASAPQFNVYLHRARPDGWHATGTLGYSHQRLALERPIDLGIARGTAHAERTLDTTYAYAEGGREFAAAGGTLSPFAAVHATTVRGGAFAEAGSTGFELVGQASRHLRGGGDVGVRYTRQWQWNAGERWVRMDVAARQRQWFAVEDDFQAAFAGAPDLVFDVAGMPVPRSEFGWNWTLTGGATDRLAWMFRYEQREADRGLAMGLAVGF